MAQMEKGDGHIMSTSSTRWDKIRRARGVGGQGDDMGSKQRANDEQAG